MSEYAPSRAKLLTTPDGHELVVGRPASGKTTKTIHRVGLDVTAGFKTWVISMFSRDLTRFPGVDWAVGSVDEAVDMLRSLSTIIDKNAYEDQKMVLTIDDATFLLKEIDILTEVEFLVETSPSWLMLRLALASTHHWGVAGSTTLYDTLIKDAKETD